MSEPVTADLSVRRAEVGDCAAIGRLLDDFNREFDEPTPGPQILAGRVSHLLDAGDTIVLLGGGGPDAVAVLRLRPSIWSDGCECTVAEFYVGPALRGRGMGRALMRAAIDVARRQGADRMELATGQDNTVARALYESLGFSNASGGSVTYFYERDPL